MKETPIEATAIIIERKGDHNFTASLPNGKIVMAHTPLKLSHLAEKLQEGDSVILEMTPFDFDKGRIASILN